ncbi:MAG: transcriptional regulator [Pseudomonadota bacterium]
MSVADAEGTFPNNQFKGLDRLLEHRSRLAICALLSGEPGITFSRFKGLLGETDGNLGAHLRRLEEAGYIEVVKSFVARKPESRYRLSAAGHRRLKTHLDALAALIAVAR